jgi:copper chaperone CopZ
MMETLRLTVRNAICSGWEHVVKRDLHQVGGVEGVTASYKANLIGVTFDASKITPAALQERIEALGYDVVPCG